MLCVSETHFCVTERQCAKLGNVFPGAGGVISLICTYFLFMTVGGMVSLRQAVNSLQQPFL